MYEDASRQFNTQIYQQLRELWRFNPRKCLHSESCEERTIKAHSVPRNVLSRMQEHGHVLQPINKISKNQDGRATGQPILEETGINEASTGYFVCRPHDGLFEKIDAPETDLSDIRILNLLMYRASLKELWTQIKTIETVRNVTKDFALPVEVIADVRLRAISDLVLGLKDQIEESRDQRQSKPLRIEHVIKHIRTDFPFLAASSAGSASDVVTEKDTGRVLSLAAGKRLTGRELNTTWTITVIPKEKEHTVVISYLKGSYAENYFSHIQGSNGTDLQEAVSAELLVFCENWFIHPAVWKSFGLKRQKAMQETFDNFDKIIEGRYDYKNKRKNVKWYEFLGITNRHQINLFRH